MSRGETDQPASPLRSAAAAVPRALIVSAIIALCIVALAAGGWVLLRVLNSVSPAVTGVAFAMLLTGLLLPLKRLLGRVIRNSHAAAGLTMIIFLGGLIGTIWVAGAQIVGGFGELRDNVFAALEEVQDWLEQGPLAGTDIDIAEYLDQAQTWVTENSQQLLGGALAAGGAVTSFSVALILALVTTFFFLADGRRIWHWFVGLLPHPVLERVDTAFSNGFHSVRSYVKTQAIVAGVDALGIGIGALILGLPLVVPMTIIVFLASFIPVVGAVGSGALLVLIAWFSEGFTTALIMLGIVVLVNQVEGNVLQPVLMSRAVDLHPWGVIMGVTIGGYVYGIIGALFAVPVMAMVKVVVQSLRAPAAILGAEHDDHRGPPPDELVPLPEPDPASNEISGTRPEGIEPGDGQLCDPCETEDHPECTHPAPTEVVPDGEETPSARS